MNLKMQALPIVFFERDGVVIARCVPLDVSSRGGDLQEAKRNICYALNRFIEACEEMGTLEEVLGSC